ncbi:CRISPR-associated protein Cas4 [Clostridium botulinum]|uniref:CRISPR-associated protein Cas4 n=1 Tax=Clostridium botulinum TaxID=1491 RepID=UPI0004DA20F2|nr:CRISPR-associated protein Cas4 [Clostridium botulinum]KEI06833.1 CRISPR-associated protein Cas4 [Clostridium botulinum C/D str. BKT75002]KEI11588.1 CRISPR-associated protein Cas4 [Clostridium botulinum C/D str. BKT2873]QPW61771.1 CRISPR-associated protein Cas4 [Clostridium botulinum]
MEFNFDKFKTQGVKVNYYYVCKRKLWLFSKGIALEEESDRVMSGKIIHEDSYNSKKNKEVLIDNILRLDILDKDYVREVKITSKMPMPDKMQLIYYLFYLKSMGIDKKGSINYVKEKRTEEIELTSHMEEEVKSTLIDINKIINSHKPPKLKKLPYCTKCAYYQFCFAGEKEE